MAFVEQGLGLSELGLSELGWKEEVRSFEVR